MRWLEMTVTTTTDSSEAVCAKLLDLGAEGVYVEDPLDWNNAVSGLGDIFPEQKENNKVIIRGYLPLSFLARARAEELSVFLERLPGFGLGAALLECREANDENWEHAWKDHWHPTEVGNRLLIVPSWREVPRTDRLVMSLDPGPAFGTGTHETTRLCLEMLEPELNQGATVIDLGCGSGILTLYSLMLGAGLAVGVDRDEAAVSFSRKNAALNRLAGATFIVSDLLAVDLAALLPPANLVLANLTASLLVELAPRLPKLFSGEGTLIASGIVRERAREVAAAFARNGFSIKQERNRGEWVAFLMELKQ